MQFVDLIFLGLFFYYRLLFLNSGFFLFFAIINLCQIQLDQTFKATFNFSFLKGKILFPTVKYYNFYNDVQYYYFYLLSNQMLCFFFPDFYE